MKKLFSNQIRFTKSQRIAVSVLMLGLLSLELFGYFQTSNQPSNKIISIPQEVQSSLNQSHVSSFNSKKFTEIELEKFNPNELNAEQWQALGFSEKQVVSILKYKKSLGGKFHSKVQIQRCYVISDEKFEELEPFILLPNSSKNDEAKFYNNDFKIDSPKITYKKFNPNNYKEEDWVKIGFSPKQAVSILKYKKSLGGKFTSIEQIEASYVISEKKFQEMKAYIDLPSIPANDSKIKSETKEENVVELKPLEKFNPNEFSREQWMEIGFTEKQVNTIMNYKRSLGGKFKDAETLKKCYSISEEKFKEIEPFLVFQ